MKGIWIAVNKLPFGSSAMALFPFVLYKKKHDCKRTRQHEQIHLYQQLEMLVLPFYIWYLFEWCIGRLKYGCWKTSYYNISFEREAYTNDTVNNYLHTRKWYIWCKYMVP